MKVLAQIVSEILTVVFRCPHQSRRIEVLMRIYVTVVSQATMKLGICAWLLLKCE